MGLGVLGLREPSGGLDDDVSADRGPVQLARVALLEDADRLAVDGDGLLVEGDLAGETAEDRVVLEQVSQGLVVRQVVDGDNLGVRTGSQQGAEEVAADAAEAVDANLHSHVMGLLR